MKDFLFWGDIKHFKKNEFTCMCGCGFNNIDISLVKMLEKSRVLSGVPFIINSACRCNVHNKKVDGSPTSSHLDGFAVDIDIFDASYRFKVVKALVDCGFNRIGVYESFIHCDIDKTKLQNVIWYK